MSRAFNSLERVLRLESQQGFQNKAVVGGIRQFATFWVNQAREEAVDEADNALVEQVADLLMDYGRLPGTEAREKAVKGLLGRLEQRQKRVAAREGAPQSGAAQQVAAQQVAAQQVAAQQVAATERPPRQMVTPPPPPKSKATRAKQPAPQPAPSATPDLPTEAGPTADERPVTAVAPDPEGLKQPVVKLPGVGPKIASLLARLGAEAIGELLYIFPRRYDDYTLLKPINRLAYGEQVTVIGTIWETRARRSGSQTRVQSIISDGTGTMQATWFNQPWLADSLKAGMQVVLSGVVDQFLGRLVFQSPEWEPLDIEPLRTRRIVPVYPLTKGLTSHKMRELMKAAVDQWAGRVPDPLPDGLLQRLGYFPLPQALRQMHFPDSQGDLHRARQRLVFEELLLLQLGMLRQRRDWQSIPGVPLAIDQEAVNRFTASLPFPLTGAQERVVAEIIADLQRSIPMNRLLQGDVGSGKTVVAAAAMVAAVAAGKQAALMAPTEILAEQHFQGLSGLLSAMGVTMRLLTGSTPAREKETIYDELRRGAVQLVIGTHALIQEAVQFRSLALVVIDEQHRFGVDQRQALRDKGQNSLDDHGAPHLLVMSATPIPRTLALSMFGDLDLSILDEMPPGRQEIKTRWLRPSERERAYSFVRGQIDAGRQAFFICPLVEESDNIEAKAAVEEHARLQKEIFPNYKLGLLHGRMTAVEKEAAMRAFYQGETHILVATSVIEVGIDVPNSTVIVIEGANRFGLAQLHQFRGRVGRGQHQSYCLLISESVSPEAEERLEALERSNDGFVLAEKDLELRGPGEFFGRRQSGLPELKLASLLDVEMLTIARQEADLLFRLDPWLEKEENQLLQERVMQFWQDAGDVS
jgi:ATP-dependent DNA helicase RecG